MHERLGVLLHPAPLRSQRSPHRSELTALQVGKRLMSSSTCWFLLRGAARRELLHARAIRGATGDDRVLDGERRVVVWILPVHLCLGLELLPQQGWLDNLIALPARHWRPSVARARGARCWRRGRCEGAWLQ
jgi:hypothetical protein